jgi:hypothetical protein
MLWKWASFSIGALSGSRERTLFCGELREKGEILLYQEASFIGESERYVEKSLRKRANLSSRALLGNLEEGSFTGDFERQ